MPNEDSAPESIEVEVAPENGSDMPPDQYFNKEILEDEPRIPASSSKSTQKKTRTLELELEEYQLARDRLRRMINLLVMYA